MIFSKIALEERDVEDLADCIKEKRPRSLENEVKRQDDGKTDCEHPERRIAVFGSTRS